MLTAVFKLRGHLLTGPTGVRAQSVARISAPSRLLPQTNRVAVEISCPMPEMTRPHPPCGDPSENNTSRTARFQLRQRHFEHSRQRAYLRWVCSPREKLPPSGATTVGSPAATVALPFIGRQHVLARSAISAGVGQSPTGAVRRATKVLTDPMRKSGRPKVSRGQSPVPKAC
jgi:hypothetical protein